MSYTAPARSWEWVNHVRDNCRMASSARHVLMAIATYADASGHAHPSQRELADATGYNERHIRRLLVDLETEGWLVTTDGRGRGHRTDFTIVAEPAKADLQSRNCDTEKRTPEAGIEQAKADAESRNCDDKSGHLEQQKRTSGTLKADICASEYKEVEPAIEPEREPTRAPASDRRPDGHRYRQGDSVADPDRPTPPASDEAAWRLLFPPVRTGTSGAAYTAICQELRTYRALALFPDALRQAQAAADADGKKLFWEERIDAARRAQNLADAARAATEAPTAGATLDNFRAEAEALMAAREAQLTGGPA